MAVTMKTPMMILGLFKDPKTYTLELDESLSRDWLEEKGYIKRHPEIFGSRKSYWITAEGRNYYERAHPKD